jgi:hypothetical protein
MRCYIMYLVMFYGVCSLSIHVMFYDVFSDVHIIYIRCSIMYLVIFYDVISDVHVIYMRCYIM